MGVVRASELIEQGMNRSAISRRTKSGELTRLLPEIYASATPDYMERCTAVAMWRPDALISHRSAAWLWGLVDEEPSVVEATIPAAASSRAPQWVRLHRRTIVRSGLQRGLRVVTIEQCLVDVAVSMSTAELEALFDKAIGVQVDWQAIANLCSQSSGRHGIVEVRRQLRTCCPMTRSEPERLVARALAARRIRMEINARVGQFFGDLVCFRARVIIEIDGRDHHIDPRAFNNDRRRQNIVVLDGWIVLRYSAAMVMAHLDIVVDEIIETLRKRRKSINSKGRTLPVHLRAHTSP
ncbi:DUF559 domain-containing protein [Rhodococcus sp. G-MC3]|uniref:DUF559 domain-containing protein n=1 Tax=Rhodococcus sp. G-MC3 TaxID=3046209 RepID=UPI0024BA5D55|nr:DUF559 domain-containing protein [Rhodococcus sp. G-MC3]MDJ0396532.1 DUF559 domain-containing protein [Rhodococcus sp. G-MC3]